MKKIVTIVGARPQFIKANMLSRVFKAAPDVEECLVHTGQHYDDNMSEVFFTELGIPTPAYNLGIGGGTLGQMTGRQLEKIEDVLLKERPDLVLVYGDTNSTLAGAISAAQLRLPLVHVEAGLRSYNRNLPEEINRVLTDQLSNLLLCPTEDAIHNLAKEGIQGDHVINAGDVMFDAAKYYAGISRTQSKICEEYRLKDNNFKLATVHRPDNTTNDISNLEAIFKALRILAEDEPLIIPLHPRTRKALENTNKFGQLTQGLTLLPPVGFLDMVRLTQGCNMVITDSGGLQKEAYFHHKPVIILRHETEWKELLGTGWAKLVPQMTTETILSLVKSMGHAEINDEFQPYGQGHAAELMYSKIKTFL